MFGARKRYREPRWVCAISHDTPYGSHDHGIISWLPTDLAYRLYARQMRRCPENRVSQDEYYAREPMEMAFVLSEGLNWDKPGDHRIAVHAVEKGWTTDDSLLLAEARRMLDGGAFAHDLAHQSWTVR